ncbi:MAG: terpene cyclase/mutase family protein [Planctomycetes bacterium]|nr:terpene cyclase/mutase family protein [Planctomycetota bacterium]
MPQPGSDLPAMARAARAMSERERASPSPPSSQRRPQAIALRDHGAARTAAVPATAAPLATSATVRRQIEALAAPAAAAVSRPQRSPVAGLLADTTPRVAPPGSLLERAASRPLAAAPATAQPLASTPYSNRFGPAKAKALEQFGGSVATERAVANGLRYLASIQKADGSWGDQRTFHDKYGSVYVGKTALCLLAFLGAGHTPASATEYSDHVRRAVAHLVALQDPDSGAFGVSSAYGHGITTYALAECYGLTKDPALRRPVEEGLTWILQNQGPRRDRRNQGGWGYFSPGLQREDDYARMSVSSWMVMALESAKLSGIDVPTEALTAARRYVELAYDRDAGWFRYAHKPERLNSSWPTLPASTPAAAFMLMLLGTDKEDERVRTAAEYTAQRRPQEYRRYDDDDFVLRGQGNVYFWYYGSLCCFLAGGDVWERWNQRLSTILPAAQNDDGSFTPIDQYASYAGDTRKDRSYTTAMCVLSLEVYYRYFTPLLVGR